MVATNLHLKRALPRSNSYETLVAHYLADQACSTCLAARAIQSEINNSDISANIRLLIHLSE